MNVAAKKFDLSFLKHAALSFVVIAACAAYPLARFATPEIVTACAAGAALSYANAIAGFMAIEYAFDKPFTVFMKAVLGGMGVRMLVSAGVLVVLISVMHLHVLALVLSLMLFYAVNLTLEILFLQKKMNLRTQSVR